MVVMKAKKDDNDEEFNIDSAVESQNYEDNFVDKHFENQNGGIKKSIPDNGDTEVDTF